VLLQAILNFAGLALLVPLLILILSPQSISPASRVGKIYSMLHIPNETVFTIVVCVGSIILIIIKNGLIIFINSFRTSYINRLFLYFSEKLYTTYYRKGFLFVKQNHTTSFTHKINGICSIFVQGIVSRLFIMGGEALLMLLVVASLMFYSWVLALLLAFCLLPATWFYYLRVRKKISLYGKMESEVWRKQARLISETFRGYPDMRINRAFPLFLKRFRDSISQIAFYRERLEKMMNIPDGITELGVALGMILLVLFHRGDAGMKVTFGILAVAAMRLLPSVRMLINGWIQLKNNGYAIDTIREALDTPEEELSVPDEMSGGQPAPLHFNHKIEIEGLTFRFPDALAEEPPVIQNLSLTIAKGERIGIRGMSGIGKTTLFNLLLGLYQPREGTIRIDGILLTTSFYSAWYDLIGYVPQDVFLTDGTIVENIAFGKPTEEIDRERIKNILKIVRLDDFTATLPEDIDTPLGENGCRLSGGQRQRIGIARALYKQAEILFFDEATSSLDPATEKEITDAIRELSDNYRELTLILITHRNAPLEFCDRIIEL
jgi:ABC-type multidrug transport system fused ATPase/permease subunit